MVQPYTKGIEFQEATVYSLSNCKAPLAVEAKEKVEQVHHALHISDGPTTRFLLVTTAKTLEVEYD